MINIQEFEPLDDTHVASVHVTEAEWFLPLLQEAKIPFEITKSRAEPLGGLVWALEGGYGQLISIDIFVEKEYQDRFHKLFSEKFTTGH